MRYFNPCFQLEEAFQSVGVYDSVYITGFHGFQARFPPCGLVAPRTLLSMLNTRGKVEVQQKEEKHNTSPLLLSTARMIDECG